MHAGLRFALLPGLILSLAPSTFSPAEDLRGYSPESAKVQLEWERKFRAIPEPGRQRDYLRRLSARPHHLGSPYEKQNAEYMRDLFASFGWDAKIEEFSVLFPTPKERLLEMTAPTKFVARLDEPVLSADPTTSQKSEQLPTYNAYSADGDVEGPLVYVNYGVPADYLELEKRGVSVKGAIVIARYGGSWRGIKPKVAYEHGAIGCIIYSDPKDDGYAQGDVYPVGPWRPKDGVQRGSVLDMPVYPGDPLTPFVGATKDAKRLDIKDAKTIMKIPVLPISYADAQPLLAALGGHLAPEAWRGALPLTYKLGPGPTRVHLKLKFNWNQTPLYNVVAMLRGSERPDEWIVRGNHTDGWVNGASDPLAGMVAELEEARALGELVKQGWKPKRTIIYTGWDGEEPALLGSTEWAETHAADLRDKGVLYINTDGNGRGYFGAGGSHSLESLVNDVARDIPDPESGVTVWKRMQAAAKRFGSPEQQREASSRRNLRIGALGSGSDFTPFLQHLGVATLNLGFGGEDGGGDYHSIYDSFEHFVRFSDTSFVYGRALSQTVGTMVMRVANADLLPFEFTELAETVSGYVGELKSLRDGMASSTEQKNRMIEDGVFAATNDPKDPVPLPKAEEIPPHLNFAPLDNASDALTRASGRFERAYTKAPIGTMDKVALQQVNTMMRATERLFTYAEGLPMRPWYEHLLYAPGFYTGYGVKTLPGIREAIEQKDWKMADVQMTLVTSALNAGAEHINKMASILEGKPVP
jgi:N-acetylated-alpha-linked acidic dipeptidase